LLEEQRIPELPPVKPVEVFQARIFYLEKEEAWAAVIHSCVDNQNSQLTNKNLSDLMQHLRKRLLKKDKSLRNVASPIIDLAGNPFKRNGTNP
jgi:hypothetical protein